MRRTAIRKPTEVRIDPYNFAETRMSNQYAFKGSGDLGVEVR